MRVTTAMLPEASTSQDRILTTSDAVVVLDGASAFVPVEVSPATYVDTLGGFLVEGLTADPRAELALVLGRAIERTATLLGLRAVEGGYWIAEAVPEAAAHAVTARLPVVGTPWLVLATDGAHRPMQHLRLDDWARVARLERHELHGRLADLQRWEADDDPDGLALPRAKRHDDKSLAVAFLGCP